MTIPIRIRRLHPNAVLPRYARLGDAGMDLVAVESVLLRSSGEQASVATGLAIELPEGFAGLILPRSGLAARHGITVVNSPGLIDSGYRGELKVILQKTHHVGTTFRIAPGDRIAQLVVLPLPAIEFIEAEELERTERGERGFGSTGITGAAAQ